MSPRNLGLPCCSPSLSCVRLTSRDRRLKLPCPKQTSSLCVLHRTTGSRYSWGQNGTGGPGQGHTGSSLLCYPPHGEWLRLTLPHPHQRVEGGCLLSATLGCLPGWEAERSGRKTNSGWGWRKQARQQMLAGGLGREGGHCKLVSTGPGPAGNAPPPPGLNCPAYPSFPWPGGPSQFSTVHPG